MSQAQNTSEEAKPTFVFMGIPVRIHPSFFIMALILGLPRGNDPDGLKKAALWVAVVAISILWHELGHAFAIKFFGGRPSIELYSMGGLTYHHDHAGLTHPKRIIISLAGPMFGFMLGAAVFGLSLALPQSNHWGEVVVGQMLWVNVGWGLLNLLPILPLDGGNVVDSGLAWAGLSNPRRKAHIVSAVIGGLMAAVALGTQNYFGAMLVGYFTLSNIGQLKGKKDEEPAPGPLSDDEFQRVLAHYQERIGQGDREVISELQQIVMLAETPFRKACLVELLIWTHLRFDEPEDALAAATLMPDEYGLAPELSEALAKHQPAAPH